MMLYCIAIGTVLPTAFEDGMEYFSDSSIKIEKNCGVESQKIQKELTKQGYNATIIDGYVYHSWVSCQDCRNDTELWYDYDGSIIYAYQNYIPEDLIEIKTR